MFKKINNKGFWQLGVGGVFPIMALTVLAGTVVAGTGLTALTQGKEAAKKSIKSVVAHAAGKCSEASPSADCVMRTDDVTTVSARTSLLK